MKKKWTIVSKNKKKLHFYPSFVSNAQNEVQCMTVMIKEGEREYLLNYLDLLMFCYFIGNEEQRMKLANIRMKRVRDIPYDVTFKLSSEEKEKGVAKRRIMVPIDELIMAVAQWEAKKSNFLKKLKK